MLTTGLFGQKTGVFGETFLFNDAPFNGISRSVAFSVPSDYNASKNYTLIIGLHGCGNSEINFRNALSTIADSLNAIVMCPNSGLSSINDEFNGREVEILNSIYDTLNRRYNIDTKNIYLTGFSCNGREAIPIVLEKKTNIPFAGVIAYAPAINSPNINGTSYHQTAVSPLCICMGDQDFFYTQQPFYFSFIDSLNSRSATYKENIMPFVGHSTNHPKFNEFMLDCFDYVSAQTTIGTSLIQSPKEFYSLHRISDSQFRLISKSTSPINFALINLEGRMIKEGQILEKNEDVIIEIKKNNLSVLQIMNVEGAFSNEKIMR